MKGTIIKLSDNENKLRTDSMKGEFEELPEVGKSFQIVGESLSEGLPFRIVTTSLVKKIKKTDSGYQFQTVNSLYSLGILVN